MTTFTIIYIIVIFLLAAAIATGLMAYMNDWWYIEDWQSAVLFIIGFISLIAFLTMSVMLKDGKDTMTFRSDEYDTLAMISDLESEGITVEQGRSDYTPLRCDYEGSYLQRTESYFTGKVTWTYYVALEDDYKQYRFTEKGDVQ